MLIIHIITEHFPPTKGGLEEWTRDLCDIFSALNAKPIVYICSDKESESESKFTGDDYIYISNERELLEEPLIESNLSFAKLKIERQRLNHLLIKKHIISRIKIDVKSKHIVLSNFLIGTGFLATTIAEALDIPHIACVVGTDFSRGFVNSVERGLVEFVARNASFIVTKNFEQEKWMARFSKSSNVKTIHTSIDSRVLGHRWIKVEREYIKLVSDCGYSSKKGTQILLNSFSNAVSEGLPVSLTIYGKIVDGEERYWNKVIDTYSLRFGRLINFNSFIEKQELWPSLIEHDIYCSATIGEGSSHARASALCLGMPIVTTSCGEMADLATGQRHVLLSLPGDYLQFSNNVRDICNDFLKNEMTLNEIFIREVGQYFSRSTELNQWKKILDHIRS